MSTGGRSPVGRRHVLVIASQCLSMARLTFLQEAATSLNHVLRNPDAGACEPGLPDGVSLLYGELDVRDIEDKVRAAIALAASSGATLVLALLGHGFIAGMDPALYLMGRDSREEVRDTAVDVRRLLVEAADRPGVKGVIAIIDTCTAAAAAPPTAELATGARTGQTRLALLMASAVGQPAYQMNMSRALAGLLRTGVPEAGSRLQLGDVSGELKGTLPGQDVVSFFYDGDHSAELTWLSHNIQLASGISSSGSAGTEELRSAVRELYPDQAVPAGWDAAALRELRDKLRQETVSPASIRTTRIVDSLIVARQTVSFLRTFMAAKLSSEAIRRALTATGALNGSWQANGTDSVPLTEVDAVESVALTYPRAERTCRAHMTRFVVALADDAGIDLESPALRDWASSLDALVAFNDAVAARISRHVERRLRLIVSLYALAGEWPEELGGWLLYDGKVCEHDYFACQPDQAGAEETLITVVDWAEKHANSLGVPLQRIEVAMPARILLSWRPEEICYGGPRLGLNYTVLSRWSQRLDPHPEMLRVNRNAARRLAQIAAQTASSPLEWLGTSQVSQPARLRADLGAGKYAPAIGLLNPPGQDDALLELLLGFVPIVLWPQATSLKPRHCRLVKTSWHQLPEGFLTAYRARWTSNRAVPVANIRAVWDDEDWLSFCSAIDLK